MLDMFENDLKELKRQREQVLAQLNAVNGAINYIGQKIAAMEAEAGAAEAPPEVAMESKPGGGENA